VPGPVRREGSYATVATDRQGEAKIGAPLLVMERARLDLSTLGESWCGRPAHRGAPVAHVASLGRLQADISLLRLVVFCLFS